MEKCAQCGEFLPFRMDDTEIMPCPECGAATRIAVDSLKEKITFKAKPFGASGKKELEITMGDDFYKKEQKWQKIKRVIDRGHDYYEERIVDPKTGETVHNCQEPLTSHIGHGSATHTRKRGDQDNK